MAGTIFGFLLWLISLIPRPVMRVGLIFLLGFSCGQVTAYRMGWEAAKVVMARKAQAVGRGRPATKELQTAKERVHASNASFALER